MKISKAKSKAVESHAAALMHEQAQTSSSQAADQIAIAAYFKAEARGFEPGHELEDWLAAEKEMH